MKVIVNATPLIAFALIDRIDLFRELFDDVIVPAEVYDEVVIQGAGKPGAKLIAQTTWLQVEPPQSLSAIDPLLTGLDAGEMAVLLLAQQNRLSLYCSRPLSTTRQHPPIDVFNPFFYTDIPSHNP